MSSKNPPNLPELYKELLIAGYAARDMLCSPQKESCGCKLFVSTPITDYCIGVKEDSVHFCGYSCSLAEHTMEELVHVLECTDKNFRTLLSLDELGWKPPKK